MKKQTKVTAAKPTKLEKVIAKRFHATWITRHECELSEQELLFLASKNPENLRVIDRLAGLLTPQKSEAINLTFQQAQSSAYQTPAPAPTYQAPYQPQAQAPQYQPQAPAPAFQAPAYQPPTQAQAPAFQAPAYQPPTQAQAPAYQLDNPDIAIVWEKDKSGKFWETYSFKPEYLLHFGFLEQIKAGKTGSYSIFEKETHKIYVFPTTKGRKVRISISLEATKMLYEDCRQSFKTPQTQPSQA
jgi:hypothetical protein